MRHPRLVPFLALAGATALMLLLGATASSYGPAPAASWVVSGGTQSGGLVSSVAVSGSTAYLGGNFDYVGPETGSFVGVDSASSSLVSPWPTVGGSVFAVAPDGSGGFFIGGFFTSIGTKHVDNIAHIKADGTLDTNWAGATNGTVYAIQVSNSTVYAGGAFTTAGGASHVNLAAFNLTSGAVSASFPNATGTGSFVASLRLTSSTLYVGGLFTAIGDSARTNIGAITTLTGSVSAWAPSTDGTVYAISISVGGTVYVGGAFTHATGSKGAFERTYAAAFNPDPTNAAVTVWDPGPDGQVYALEVVGSTVFVGGAFSDIGATPDTRIGLGAVTAASGELASWNPRLNVGSQVYAISAPGNGSTVYAGGSFGRANTSIQRDNVAGFQAAPASDGTAPLTGLWSIVGGNVDALALSGTTLGVGGEFRTAGGGNGTTAAPRPRANLAAIDLTTGMATNWNPSANDGVETLAVSGSRVYAGGEFTVVNGNVARQRLAAFDTNLGNATPWDPSVHDNAVFALAVSGSTVYAGGSFTNVSKVAGSNPAVPIFRNGVAAFDADGVGTGFGDLRSGWDPNATISGATGSAVFAIDVVGSTVYLGGSFNRLRSAFVRNHLAAVPSDTSVTANPTAWDPNLSDSVFALAHSGSVEYAGGPFLNVNGNIARPAAAAFDTTTGTATSWNPQFLRNGTTAGTVYSLAASGSTIYASGIFRTVGGLWTNGSCVAPCFLSPEVAAVSPTTGAPNTSWAPGANDLVSSIALSPQGLVMGGQFTTIGIPPPGTVPVSADELTANYHGSFALVHALPDAPAVSATGGNTTAHVTFAPPAYTGGASIASYTLTANPGNIVMTNVSSPVDLNGLANGTTYTFSVTANTADGTTGAPGTATAKPRTVPDAPTGVTGTPGDTQVTVSFTAPNDGGDAITMYTVQASPGNTVATGTGTSIVVPGLRNDGPYTFTVTATNSAGTSAVSAPSDPVIPHEGGRPHQSAPDPTPRPAVPDLPPDLPARIPPPGHAG